MAGLKMSKTVYDVKLIDLMPESIKYDPQIIAACSAIQPELNELATLSQFADLYGNIDNLPIPILRALAWENQMFEAEWAMAELTDTQAELVKNSWLLNRLRGTKWSIIRIFEVLGMRAEIVEWFEENAEPGTFRISVLDVTGVGLTKEMEGWISSLIYAYKPLSRHITATNMYTKLEPIVGYALVGGHSKIKYSQ